MEHNENWNEHQKRKLAMKKKMELDSPNGTYSQEDLDLFKQAIQTGNDR